MNKRYTKEEYEALLPKVMQHLSDMPYTDSSGRVFSYGEFFPVELSPFSYNETIAQEYFPLTKEKILNKGYIYRDHIQTKYTITKTAQDLPDHINEISETILEDIIACPNNGDELTQCTFAFRIMKSELDFLRQHQIALPRYCPNCRHYKRLAKRNPLKLWHRSCMCSTASHGHENVCQNEFETSYAPERPEIIYCESCYQKEVI